jgi:hypothetical protein
MGLGGVGKSAKILGGTWSKLATKIGRSGNPAKAAKAPAIKAASKTLKTVGRRLSNGSAWLAAGSLAHAFHII